MPTTKSRKPLSWTPVLSDYRYCSPACGRGCTKAEHDAAQKNGERLAAWLGKGWHPRVWENLGWHYSAVSACDRLEVHTAAYPGHPPIYTAFLREAGRGPGGAFAGQAKTPGAAIRKAVREAKEEARRLNAMVAGL